MKTTIYLHADRDSLWEKGERLGLAGEALRMFSFTACEVEVGIDVNMETGESTIVTLDGRVLQ